MSIYLGTPGRMVRIKCPATQQVVTTDGYSFDETLEGRVKAQARSVQRRVWQLGTSDATTPADQATLLGFVAGEWGSGPFVFVSADAPVTNLLTPEVSLLSGSALGAGVTPGGPVDLGREGLAGRSFINPAPAVKVIFGSQGTPVLPGQAVTVSAYLDGAGPRIGLRWYTAAGSFLGDTLAAPASGWGFRRASLTVMPPEGAAACLATANDTTAGTRPAITWTDEPFPWAVGEGCGKAVVHAASKNVVMASRDPRGGRFAALSYTITEVG